MKTFSISEKGPRASNQDYTCLTTIHKDVFACVADGVGGNNGGEVASKTAVESLKSDLEAKLNLKDSIIRAHELIKSKSLLDGKLTGMATTLTAIIIGEHELKGIHCGDSRAYILRGNGIMQLTTDHTEVAKLLRDKKITKEQSINYPRKNILTSALGTHKELEYQEFEFKIQPQDRIFILSDGTYSAITKYALCELSKSENNFERLCQKIITTVEEFGPTDNFSLVGVEI